MAFHPTGHALLADFDRVALINRSVHALAIAGTITTVAGLVGLRRSFAPQSVLVDLAIVSYGFGALAVMFAAIASGLLGTELSRRVLEAGDGGRAVWETVMVYNFALNQATTQVFVVAASIGILLWSLAMLEVPRFGKSLGLTGIVVGGAAVSPSLIQRFEAKYKIRLSISYGLTEVPGATLGAAVVDFGGVLIFASGVGSGFEAID